MAVKVFPAQTSSGGALADWSNTIFPATGFAVGDKVVDTTIMETFRCIVAHIPTLASLPPSQDPTNWKGNDEKDIGKVVTMGHMRDAGPLLAMTPGRTISRTKYKRLLEAIAPQKTNVQITNGSNIMLLDAGQDADIPLGAVIEMPGVPAGAMVVQKTTPGSKVATVDAAKGFMFFRPGVIGTGYQIAPPVEFTGPGEGGAGNGKVTATKSDASGTVSTVLGSLQITATPATTVFNGAVAGDYITSPGLPANTRLTGFDGQVITTANVGTVAASNQLFMGLDFYSQIDETLLTNRQISSSPVVTATALSATPVVSGEQTLPLNWSAVAGTGIFAPWNAAAGDLALLPINRRVGMDATPLTQETFINAAVNPAVNRNGGTWAGLGSYFWQTGQAVVPQTLERRIGNNPAIPALAYINSHTNEVAAVSINVGNSQPNISWPIGAAATGQIGQFLTTAAGGLNQARIITAPVAQFTRANSGTTNGQPMVWLQPGTVAANYGEMQLASGGGINAAAGNRVTTIAADNPFARVRFSGTVGSPSNIMNMPLGFLGVGLIESVPGAKFTSALAGVAAGATNFVSASGIAPTVVANGNVTAGTGYIGFAPGTGITATWVQRYVQSLGNSFPVDTYIAAVAPDFNILNVRAAPAPRTSALFFTAGTAVGNVAVGAKFTLPVSYPAGGTISANAVPQFNANIRTAVGSSNAFPAVGFDWRTIASGQQLSGNAAIPAGSHVGPTVGYSLPGATAGAYDTPLAKATTIPGQAWINVPVGWLANVWTPTQGESVSVTAGIPANTTVNGVTNPEVVIAVGPQAFGASKITLPPGSSVVGWTEGRYIQASGWPADTRILATPPAGDIQADGGNVLAGSNRIFTSIGGNGNVSGIGPNAALAIGAQVRVYNQLTSSFWAGTYTVTNAAAETTAPGYVSADGLTIIFDAQAFSPNYQRGQMLGNGSPIDTVVAGTRNIQITTTASSNGAVVTGGDPITAQNIVGALIHNCPAFPAGTRVTAYNAGTNTITFDFIANATGAQSFDVGETVNIWSSTPITVGSRGVQPAIKIGAYIELDNPNPQPEAITPATALQIFTGPQVSLSANAASAMPAGGNVTLGKTIPLSAAVAGVTKFLDVSTVTLGGVIPLSANATLAAVNATAAANNSTTFAPWAAVSTPAAASNMAAGGTAAFGALLTASAPANANETGVNISFGPQWTLGQTVTFTGAATDGTFGAYVLMSANATANNNNFTATFGRWATTNQNAAVVPFTATTMTLGAFSTFQNAATSAAFTAPQLAAILTDTTPATLGAFFTFGGTALTTARSNTAAKVGAILQMAANNVAAAGNGRTVTFGPVATVDQAASATLASSTPTNIGGHATVDIPFASSNIDATYIFGIGVTMARVIIPGCTYSNNNSINVGGRAFAAGGGGFSQLQTNQFACYDASQIVVGGAITGPGIPAGTTVTSVNAGVTPNVVSLSNSVTSSQSDVTLYQPVNATVTSTTGTARFFPYGNGDGANTFGIGVNADGRNITIGGTTEPVAQKWGAKSGRIFLNHLPKHNHHNSVVDASSVPNGGRGFPTSGNNTLNAPTDVTANELDLFTQMQAPWQEGNDELAPRSVPTVVAAVGLAIYAGAA